MGLTPSEIASDDVGYWSRINQIRLQAGIFTFDGHEYQDEPMRSNRADLPRTRFWTVCTA